MKELRSEYFVVFTKIFEYIFNKYAAFLTDADTRQLLRHMKAYIEKKHYHVGKKVADLGLVWHPDTLFQPNDISVGSSFFCRKYRFKHIYFQDHKPEINVL